MRLHAYILPILYLLIPWRRMIHIAQVLETETLIETTFHAWKERFALGARCGHVALRNGNVR